MASLEEKFQAAVDIVQKLPKEGPLQTSNDQKLKFYSLFKQATIGNVNTSRPGLFSPVERKKWFYFLILDAWKSVEGKSQEEAKQAYIEALLEMFDDIGEKFNVNYCLEKIAKIFLQCQFMSNGWATTSKAKYFNVYLRRNAQRSFSFISKTFIAASPTALHSNSALILFYFKQTINRSNN
ncbi:ACB domain-containing protein [Meloidogyne graminicola]|uniref:ACB domain-containing protein n=1 Tax=Meloidogyne graminicola TaxID=189291 RepID=A0A8S9ZJS5_9BILA|nr:ACB domain-containing protein [Meloidogyne graminicola]